VVVDPDVVAPDVVVPDVVLPAAVAPPAAVCAHAAPPASTVTASANAAFLRSYLMAQLLLFWDLNVGVAAMFLENLPRCRGTFPQLHASHATVNSSRFKLVL
jgi:hypothetical protein